jgi:enoyl-[acyl-carrier protein] reductase II
VEEGDIEKGSLMAGQSAGLVDEVKSVKEIITEIVDNIEKELKNVSSDLCN